MDPFENKPFLPVDVMITVAINIVDDTARALLEEVRGLQARREDLDERKQGASLLASRRTPATRVPVAPTSTPTQP